MVDETVVTENEEAQAVQVVDVGQTVTAHSYLDELEDFIRSEEERISNRGQYIAGEWKAIVAKIRAVL